jgi:hypothetical protein
MSKSAARVVPLLRFRCTSAMVAVGLVCKIVVSGSTKGIGCSPLYLLCAWLQGTWLQEDVLYVVIVGGSRMISW